MNIHITYIEHYEIWLNKPLVACFMKMSNLHYDAKCKAASADYDSVKGTYGFVTGWVNSLNNFANDKGEYAVLLDHSKLDTLLKICENTLVLDKTGRDLVYAFCDHCGRALAITSTTSVLPLSVE